MTHTTTPIIPAPLRIEVAAPAHSVAMIATHVQLKANQLQGTPWSFPLRVIRTAIIRQVVGFETRSTGYSFGGFKFGRPRCLR